MVEAASTLNWERDNVFLIYTTKPNMGFTTCWKHFCLVVTPSWFKKKKTKTFTLLLIYKHSRGFVSSSDPTLLSKELLHHLSKLLFKVPCAACSLSLTPNENLKNAQKNNLVALYFFLPSKKEVSLQTGNSSSRGSNWDPRIPNPNPVLRRKLAVLLGANTPDKGDDEHQENDFKNWPKKRGRWE